MSTKIFDQLSAQLTQARAERPKLEKDQKETDSKLLEEFTGDSPKPLFFHRSHNSHGNWNKHWAHGSFEDDPQEHTVKTNNSN